MRDSSANGHVFPEHPQGADTVKKRLPSRPGCLEAGQQDGVVLIARDLEEMMQYTPAGEHATG